MLVYGYPAFRRHFAAVGETLGVSLTYDHVTVPNTITRASGSFIDDGHVVGSTLQVIGTTDNDLLGYEIANVTASVITIIASQNFQSSETITSSLLSAFYALDGMERWPLAKVRANGFDDGFEVYGGVPLTPWPVLLTVNDYLFDSLSGESFTWYLSQRTEVAASQYIEMIHLQPAATGTVQLKLTDKAVEDLGLEDATSALNVGQRQRLLKYCYLFCKRDSDGAIQQVHLLPLSDAQAV